MECQLIELDIPFPERIEACAIVVRPEGLHLTDIIRSIMEESGMSKSTGGGVWKPASLTLAAEVGFLWEDLLSLALKSRLPNRIEGLIHEGIHMSPDGIDVDKWWLYDYKVAWASSARLPVDNWKWMAQMMGYCEGLDMRTVIMPVLYLNGNYRDRREPEFLTWKIEFTTQEVKDNWRMIINHAKAKGWL